jgi:DNA gyrase/topoisomerase IV subunit A
VIGDLTETEGELPATYAVAASSDGYALCFGLGGFVEPSQRGGRRFAKPAEGAKIVSAYVVHGEETLIAATQEARTLLCAVSEVNYLSGPGRGVILIKLADDDVLVGFKAARDDKDSLVMKTSQGGEQKINPGRYETSERGGKGREVIKRGSFVQVVYEAPPAPEPFEGGAEAAAPA